MEKDVTGKESWREKICTQGISRTFPLVCGGIKKCFFLGGGHKIFGMQNKPTYKIAKTFPSISGHPQ